MPLHEGRRGPLGPQPCGLLQGPGVGAVRGLFGFIGLTIGGWVGWWLGAFVGITTAVVLSGILSGVGLWAARWIGKEYLE